MACSSDDIAGCGALLLVPARAELLSAVLPTDSVGPRCGSAWLLRLQSTSGSGRPLPGAGVVLVAAVVGVSEASMVWAGLGLRFELAVVKCAAPGRVSGSAPRAAGTAGVWSLSAGIAGAGGAAVAAITIASGNGPDPAAVPPAAGSGRSGA
ncbi:hypothetical protein [Kineobactrum salinum]|uniref:Uncharacterized protein n=1 Tax=Kineobactrum salinum TaxID=2708301 RepID=A0A6C0U4E8_9GAMM|nr:hypothetical protein G3T16_01800 [Kineobactrum salinum]